MQKVLLLFPSLLFKLIHYFRILHSVSVEFTLYLFSPMSATADTQDNAVPPEASIQPTTDDPTASDSVLVPDFPTDALLTETNRLQSKYISLVSSFITFSLLCCS